MAPQSTGNVLLFTLWLGASTLASPPARCQGGLIFADGFESGDLAAWGRTVGEASCTRGPALTGVLEGDLGPAPAGGFEVITCLEIRNDQASARQPEVAFSGIPLPAALNLLDTGGLALVGPGDRRVAAQFDVLSRWGGPPDDASRPIRWLGVATPARVGPLDTTRYALRRYDALPAADDPFAVRITAGPSRYTVDTGVATFTLDPSHPALVEEIAVDRDQDGSGRELVYRHSPGAGPRLTYESGAGAVTLDTTDPAHVGVDAGGFAVVESGPVKAVFLLKGHFSDPAAPQGPSWCRDAGVAAYPRFGYTLVLTLTRGSRDLGLQFQFRNECSDGFGGPWFDQDVTVEGVSWELPLALGSATTSYFAGNLAVGVSGSGFDGVTLVEQARGGGSPWRRRARIRLDGALRESAESFSSPLVAVSGSDLLAAVQMPWMGLREPQALAVDGSTLSLRFVSETLNVGEGKGIWNLAKVSLVPLGLLGGTPAAFLEDLRRQGRMELERGLLVRAPLGHVNRSAVLPSLGTTASGAFKTAYEETLARLHDETVRPGPTGLWERGKVYGSQLWPDITFDPWAVDAPHPNAYGPNMNYWDPAGAELLEFLRTGDPKWVWDFALPAYWLQLFTAYLNVGENDHSNRNGFALTSGGPGCELDPAGLPTPCTADGTAGGEWHRTAFGSDDYNYNMGLYLVYALRPNAAVRERFAQAGRTAVVRYDVPREDEAQRQPFVNQVDVNRQTIQHYEMLLSCAEFVAQAAQTVAGFGTCHQRIVEVVDELVQDNLAAGVLCQGDGVAFSPPPARCPTPQQFMQNALMFPFLHRFYRNYGDPPSASLRRVLVEAPWNLYCWGSDHPPVTGAIDAGGAWAGRLECELTADGTAVVRCEAAPDSDNQLSMYAFTKPHTAALLLMAHELDPGFDPFPTLCQPAFDPPANPCRITKQVLDDPALTGAWQDNLTNDAGWWKATAQMMQSMAFAVGIYDTCRE